MQVPISNCLAVQAFRIDEVFTDFTTVGHRRQELIAFNIRMHIRQLGAGSGN